MPFYYLFTDINLDQTKPLLKTATFHCYLLEAPQRVQGKEQVPGVEEDELRKRKKWCRWVEIEKNKDEIAALLLKKVDTLGSLKADN